MNIFVSRNLFSHPYEVPLIYPREIAIQLSSSFPKIGVFYLEILGPSLGLVKGSAKDI